MRIEKVMDITAKVRKTLNSQRKKNIKKVIDLPQIAADYTLVKLQTNIGVQEWKNTSET